MSRFDYDLFVIGGGSGGVRCARIAATHGARVALAEERHLGGTCVNVGCVPKKLMHYAAGYAHAFAEAPGFGWTVEAARHDWRRLIANKNVEIARLNGIYQRLLEGPGVTVIEGRATLVDPHRVAINGESFTAERILVATGGRPWLPDDPGVREFALTSDDFFFLERCPERVVVAGGGYIAVEFAGILNGLGAKVCQVYRGELFLRGFEFDLRETLAEEMARDGVELKFRTVIERVEKAGDGYMVWFTDGSFAEADCVLFAVGRRPNSRGLGLESLGVAMDDQGAISVDEGYRTSVPSILAIGDVTNRLNLTPVAIAEGHWLADTLYGPGKSPVSYDTVPTAVFSSPEIATVGLTEDQARARGHEVVLFRSKFRPLRHTLSGRSEQTLMKLVVDRSSDQVLGAHMIGADAPEIIQGVAIALKAGATKADFDATIGIHPTAAEEFVTMRQPVR